MKATYPWNRPIPGVPVYEIHPAVMRAAAERDARNMGVPGMCEETLADIAARLGVELYVPGAISASLAIAAE